MNVAEFARQQRGRPVGVARRWRSIQHRQDALLMFRTIFRLGAAIADFRQTRQTIARIANPPLRRRADRAAQPPADLPRPCPGRRQQHDPSTEPHPRLTFRRTDQRLKLLAFLHRQGNLGRLGDASHPNLESWLVLYR